MKLDSTDRRILEILQHEARIPNVELARRIEISPPATLERVKKLEKAGVIRRYAALLDPARVGLRTHTFVEVSLLTHTQESVTEFAEATRAVDEIMECHHLTGDADFLLKIAVADIPAYEQLVLKRLTHLPHVAKLKTMVVLSTLKNETAFIPEEARDESN
jgi:Lrp/AsnC family leucine-responsive transcriptional regulator